MQPIQSRYLTDDDMAAASDDYGSRRRLNGLFRGFVKENADPLQLGRLKIRIFAIHGDLMIQDEDLPWAHGCFPPGGGSDYGTFLIPTKGSNVWVVFEQGDPHHPVWIGSWKVNDAEAKALSEPKRQTPENIERAQSMNNTTWTAPEGSEIARESQGMANHEPTVQTWNKSPKGHAIVVEERDGVERLTISDRAGNVFSMECAVTEEENTGNKSQRGRRSVLTGDALSRDKMRDNGSRLVMQDQAQSMFELDSRIGDEKITIVANDGDGGIQTGKSRQRIELLAGAGRILIESVREGQTLARITLDANTGVVTIEGEVIVDITSPCVNVTAEHINLNGEVNVAGDITVSGRLTGGDE